LMKTLRPDRLLPLFCLLAAFVGHAPAFAQDLRAETEIYTRVHDDVVQVAVEIAIDEGWHLYHDSFADKNAIGMPTTITLDAEGITWSSLHFPEPELHVQKGLGMGGPDPKIEEHHGTITVFAAGKAEDSAAIEAAAEDLVVSIRGLTCEDGDSGVCVPYNDADLEVAGNGDPTMWADFPVSLMAELGVSFTAPAMTPATKMAAATPSSSSRPGGSGQSFQEAFGSQLGGGYGANKSKAEVDLYSRVEGDKVQAVIVIDIASHWHLYHDIKGPDDAVGLETQTELNAENVTWNFIHFPEPVKYEQPGVGAIDSATGEAGDTWIWGHEGRILVYAEGTAAGEPGRVSVEMSGLTCEDGVGGTCIPWSANARSQGPGDDELFANLPASDVRPWVEEFEKAQAADSTVESATLEASGSEGEEEELGLLAFLLLAMGGGLITLLMPCTYPMIPITISFFTKQADARDGKVLPLSITYGIGIVAIFILIGVVVGPIILRFAA
ncbi:MAG: protein-disulfide reductase DsbD domain-containing protein, partial [Planctomycetota bacterium]